MKDEPRDEPKNQIRAVPLEDVRRARGEAKVAMPRSKVASLRAFRRVRADRLLGAFGILFLLIGIALIFTWEKPPPVEKKFGVDWVPQPYNAPPIVGQRLAQGGAREHTFTLQDANVTAILFSLVWADDVGDEAIEADKLQLEIVGPPSANVTNGTREDIGGRGGGNITIPIVLNGAPDIASVNAETEEEAVAAIGDRTNRTGVGDWTIRVRVLSAPGDFSSPQARMAAGGNCPPNSAPPVCTPDGGEDYELIVTYFTYRLQLKKLF